MTQTTTATTTPPARRAPGPRGHFLVYPPAWFIGRHAIEADEIAGYHIPAKSLMWVSPYTMHRHPAFWENPEVFDPERFTPERSTDRPRYAYFPFGGGHTCASAIRLP